MTAVVQMLTMNGYGGYLANQEQHAPVTGLEPVMLEVWALSEAANGTIAGAKAAIAAVAGIARAA